MPATLVSPSLSTIAPGIQEEARETVRMIGDHEAGQVFVDVGGKRIALPPEISSYLMSLVDAIASGSAVGVRFLPEELTTTTAAEQIGVSRPTLMKMIKAGEIPSYKVGTHSRLKTSEVLAFIDERRRSRVRATKELIALSDEYDD